MKTNHLFIPVLTLIASSLQPGVMPSAFAASPADASAKAEISPASGSQVTGHLFFETVGKEVHITGELSNLAPGLHGFHIHENGVCDGKDAASAGPHFNPKSGKHGGPTDEMQHRHAGDLGNITADKDGKAKIEIKDTLLSLSGESSILNRSVIVHEKADDLKSDPSGNSGARIGCGVIVKK